jgi:hypothetical protein
MKKELYSYRNRKAALARQRRVFLTFSKARKITFHMNVYCLYLVAIFGNSYRVKWQKCNKTVLMDRMIIDHTMCSRDCNWKLTCVHCCNVMVGC